MELGSDDAALPYQRGKSSSIIPGSKHGVFGKVSRVIAVNVIEELRRFAEDLAHHDVRPTGCGEVNPRPPDVGHLKAGGEPTDPAGKDRQPTGIGSLLAPVEEEL
jgi:hypothetical protein